ncbi:MAG: Flp pilus assembly secretin CpaC, partial [Verrucomicrobiales bacterium]
MKKKHVRFNWITCILVTGLLTAVGFAESLSLAPNTSHTVSIPEGVKKIIISNTGVLNASVDSTGRQVVVIATSAGNTELRIQRLEGADYVAQVAVVLDIKPIAAQIQTLLSDVEGLEVQVVGNKIIFKGDIILKRHWDLKEQVKSAYAGMILDLTRISDSVNKILAEKITSEIGLDTIKVKVSEGKTFLEGYVYDEADVERATRIAGAYSVEVIPLIKVQDVMIETDVYFLQVNSSD